MKIDLAAADLLLQTFVNTDAPQLAALAMPTLLVCGDKDFDNGHADLLADALPDARLVTIPGTHMSSVTQPELGQAIADFVGS
jgi:pimeloyl-ACP methyl ester carboxylesterase